MHAFPLELNKLLKVTDILINPLKQYAPPDSRYGSQLLMKRHDKKTYGGNRGIAAHNLNFGTRLEGAGVVTCLPQQLYFQ